jgi:hypothetical protein
VCRRSAASADRKSTVSNVCSGHHHPHRPPVGPTPRAKVENRGAAGQGAKLVFSTSSGQKRSREHVSL